MNGRCSKALTAMCIVFAAAPVPAQPPLSLDYRGYIDAGFTLTDEYQSWLDGGIGKGRFGANGDLDRRVKPVLSEAALIGDLTLGVAWQAHLQITFDDQQRHALDIGEGYISYRSPPRPGIRWRLRAGTFLPPFSLENHGIGWTSPYTLSSSALNSWIGEELRINGGELKVKLERDALLLDLFGGVFFANDAAGKLLASRGFAVHDRELALFDRTPLPRLHSVLKNPRGPFAAQANYFEPLHEIDGRPGYYLGVNLHSRALGLFKLVYYDNNGDPEKFNRTEGQYAWDTRFGAIGYRGEIAEGLTFITQALYGDTSMGPQLAWTGKRVSETTFFTAYALLGKQYRRFGCALRGEYFETWDRDRMRFTYDGSENGYALTLSTSFKPWKSSKLAAELQYLDHERSVRTFAGEAHRIDEFSVRFNYRFFF